MLQCDRTGVRSPAGLFFVAFCTPKRPKFAKLLKLLVTPTGLTSSLRTKRHLAISYCIIYCTGVWPADYDRF